MLCNIANNVLPALLRAGDDEYKSESEYFNSLRDGYYALAGNAAAIEKHCSEFDALQDYEAKIVYDLLALLTSSYKSSNQEALEVYHRAKEMADTFLEYAAARAVACEAREEKPNFDDFYQGRKP